MREFAEVFLELNRALKKLHNAKLKQDRTQTYLISCDVTDLAQDLRMSCKTMQTFNKIMRNAYATHIDYGAFKGLIP